MPDPTDRPARARWLAPAVVVLGALLVALGLWLLVDPGPGWTAVAPASGAAYDPGVAPGTVAAVLTVGAVLLVVGVVAQVGRRRRGR